MQISFFLLLDLLQFHVEIYDSRDLPFHGEAVIDKNFKLFALDIIGSIFLSSRESFHKYYAKRTLRKKTKILQYMQLGKYSMVSFLKQFHLTCNIRKISEDQARHY